MNSLLKFQYRNQPPVVYPLAIHQAISDDRLLINDVHGIQGILFPYYDLIVSFFPDSHAKI